jgi:hypothetical protein
MNGTGAGAFFGGGFWALAETEKRTAATKKNFAGRRLQQDWD